MSGSHRPSGGWTDGRNGRTRGAHLGDASKHRVVPIPQARGVWARSTAAPGHRRVRRDLVVTTTAPTWRTGATMTDAARRAALYD